jgi:hypothetical protein
MTVVLHGYGKKEACWSSIAPSNKPTTKVAFGFFDLK